MSDLVTQSLARILHSGEYERFQGIPVFDEHEVRDKDGKLVRKVGRKELEELCDRNNKRAENSGDLSPIGIGHTRPGAPENQQPEPIAYGHNWRVDNFGPAGKLAAVCDFYVKREVQDGDKTRTPKELLSSYPRRSVELWPKEWIIDWIALLRQTPKRDLGMISFERDASRGEKICYSMETSDMPDPAAAPDAMAPDQEFADKVIRCLKDIPGFTAFLDQLAAQQAPPAPAAPPVPEQNAAGAPAMASPTNAAPPAQAKNDDAERMQRDSDAIRYAKKVESLEAEVKSLREAREADMQRYARSESERIVTQLEAEGYLLDRVKEVERFAKLNDTERNERAEEVRKYYRQDAIAGGPPVGPMLHIADRDQTNGNDFSNLSEPKAREVIQYMKDHKMRDFREAARAYFGKAN